MAVITVSRQVGSGGDAIVQRVCELLDYRYFDKRLMTEVASEAGLSDHEIVDFSEDAYKVRNILERLFRPGGRTVKRVPLRQRDATGAETLTDEELDEARCIGLVRSTIHAAHAAGNVLIVGRGGQAILKDEPDVLHVRLIAPMRDRIPRIRRQEDLSIIDAEQWILRHDRATAEYLRRFFGIEWDDPLLYHVVLNTSKWSVDGAAHALVTTLEQFDHQRAG